jgi:ATP-dependent Lon protease
MLPARNRKDFEEIPEEVRANIEFIWLEMVDEAMAAALQPRAHETRRTGT